MSRIKEICDSLDVQLVCVAFIEDDKDEGFRRLDKKLQKDNIPSCYYVPSGWHWNTRQAINELFLGELEGYEKSEAIPVVLLVNDKQEVLRHKVHIYTDQSLVRAIQNAKNQS